jgi:hypothetical protein
MQWVAVVLVVLLLACLFAIGYKRYKSNVLVDDWDVSAPAFYVGHSATSPGKDVRQRHHWSSRGGGRLHGR